MHFVYTFPSAITQGSGGEVKLDWGGKDPFHRDHPIKLTPAACSPQIVPMLFSAEECHAIVKLGDECVRSRATVHDRSDLASRDYRISDIAWIEPAASAQWLFHRLAVAFSSINASYEFELAGFAEALQYTCYGPGQYFAWHADIGPDDTAGRKLSLTIQLSEPSDYDGGELQFHGGADMPVAREQGSAVFFPSYLAHQVTPVTRGLRRSLVAWAYGSTFR